MLVHSSPAIETSNSAFWDFLVSRFSLRPHRRVRDSASVSRFRRKVHTAKQFAKTEIGTKAIEKWIQHQSHPVALSVSSVQPFEGMIFLAQARVDSRHVVGRKITVSGLLSKIAQNFSRLGLFTRYSVSVRER